MVNLPLVFKCFVISVHIMSVALVCAFYAEYAEFKRRWIVAGIWNDLGAFN